MEFRKITAIIRASALEAVEQRLIAEIRDAIFAAASTGAKGDGIIAALPVECFYRIRDRSAAPPERATMI